MAVAGKTEKVMIVGCGIALATLVPVALHQIGVLRHLPDPPLDIFDSDKITQSRAAHPFGIPDSLLGLASFGTTMTLLLVARESTFSRRLLGLKLAIDAGAAVFNAGRQVVSFGRICSWCTGTAIAAGVMSYAGRHVIAESFAYISVKKKEIIHG